MNIFNEKYHEVISLGYFCQVSIDLSKLGIRDSSFPFDWLITEFKEIIDCINNDFYLFLDYNTLLQNKKNRSYYKNIYGFEFYHDFSAQENLESQIDKVYKKYNRRISRFKEKIQNKALFIRQIKDEEEYIYIKKNFSKISQTLKLNNNKIVFLSDKYEDIDFNIIKIKDKYKPLKNIKKKLKKQILNKQFFKNRCRYIYFLFVKNINKIFKNINRKVKNEYMHFNQY